MYGGQESLRRRLRQGRRIGNETDRNGPGYGDGGRQQDRGHPAPDVPAVQFLVFVLEFIELKLFGIFVEFLEFQFVTIFLELQFFGIFVEFQFFELKLLEFIECGRIVVRKKQFLSFKEIKR